MFETNSASCGGFVGISDSFGAALWGLDYAMQMAYSNFSAALFHVGGQSVFYNPFTRTLFLNNLLLLSLIISILSSTPYQPKYFSSMDHWSYLLLCSCRSRSTWCIQQLPSPRPPSEQCQHLHTSVCYLRRGEFREGLVIQLRHRSEWGQRFECSADFDLHRWVSRAESGTGQVFAGVFGITERQFHVGWSGILIISFFVSFSLILFFL